MSKKEAAQQLRRTGHTLKEISLKLQIAQSTASVWCRQPVLTLEEKARLEKRRTEKAIAARKKATKSVHTKYSNIRMAAQQAGRQKTTDNNQLHLAGCLLYWAEGTKKRNTVQFCNTDVDMMQLFIRFLRECYNVGNDKIQVNLNVHLDNGLTIEDIENYWLLKLELPRTCLRTHTIKYNDTSRKAKHPYGVCRVTIGDVQIVQSIYGAIQEYFNIDKPEWLDMKNG